MPSGLSLNSLAQSPVGGGLDTHTPRPQAATLTANTLSGKAAAAAAWYCPLPLQMLSKDK